ncbi:hypothetical protein ACFFLM_21225 [Deinococcus oregonensis]|uniref:Uncharacterized protein n=1 Tax=Deinococcus oregonensis TaxID=1805970 RepID=A0ABV6B401_9DEIO
MNPERMKAGAKVAEKAEKPGADVAPELSPTPSAAAPVLGESEGRSEAQPSTLTEGGLDPVITAVLAEIPDRPKHKEPKEPAAAEDLAESEPEASASPLKRNALIAGVAGLGLVAVAVLVRGAGGLRSGLTLPGSSTPTPPTAPAAPAVVLPAAPAGLVIGGS